MGCRVAYEVSLGARSVVFTTKKAARKFQQKHSSATRLRAVELCEATGKIRRVGKRSYR